MPDAARFNTSLAALVQCRLITELERGTVAALVEPASPFVDAIALAETVHVHVKVDDTMALPVNDFFDAGARLDHQKDGFVKFRFPGGLNAIFSHIKVSEDELVETPATRRARPFLDHIGVDLRDETAPVRAVFDALPAQAQRLAWKHAGQGGGGTPVYCCHVEVAEKHWLYPTADADCAGIPIEFAYGALKVNPGKSGCDLRPAEPGTIDASTLCCGTAAPTADAAIAPDATASYYRPGDLGRFADISRVNPALGTAFFGYYQQVMGEGVLGKREKALMALSLAHALKCPYCIDAYTDTLYELGASEEQMNEAVHVAAAMVAGVTMVHSVQMISQLDRRRAAKADCGPPGCC